uniref:Uncharacterized protein n=1 Tax=Rangifer tarandus platyrhynchus TaxID=3082113 RepID=A0ACB0DPW1_RANTA|nr:unnamed protein product [Rangifer tarandus platyrhynchus]
MTAGRPGLGDTDGHLTVSTSPETTAQLRHPEPDNVHIHTLHLQGLRALTAEEHNFRTIFRTFLLPVWPKWDCAPSAQVPTSGRGRAGLTTPARTSVLLARHPFASLQKTRVEDRATAKGQVQVRLRSGATGQGLSILRRPARPQRPRGNTALPEWPAVSLAREVQYQGLAPFSTASEASQAFPDPSRLAPRLAEHPWRSQPGTGTKQPSPQPGCPVSDR